MNTTFPTSAPTAPFFGATSPWNTFPTNAIGGPAFPANAFFHPQSGFAPGPNGWWNGGNTPTGGNGFGSPTFSPWTAWNPGQPWTPQPWNPGFFSGHNSFGWNTPAFPWNASPAFHWNSAPWFGWTPNFNVGGAPFNTFGATPNTWNAWTGATPGWNGFNTFNNAPGFPAWSTTPAWNSPWHGSPAGWAPAGFWNNTPGHTFWNTAHPGGYFTAPNTFNSTNPYGCTGPAPTPTNSTSFGYPTGYPSAAFGNGVGTPAACSGREAA